MNIQEAIQIINNSNTGQRVKPIQFDYVTMYVIEIHQKYNRWVSQPGVYCNDISIIELAKTLEKKDEK